MRLKTFIVSMMETNSYMIIDENTLDAIIIDPGAESIKIIDFIEKESIKLNAIVLTHAHFDHIGACQNIKERFNVPIVICEGEEIIIENSEYNLSSIFHKHFAFSADKILKDGEEFKFGNLKFKTILTPGHTPGGCCLYFDEEKILFSGDTLFRQSIGRTDFPYGNMEDLIISIKQKLLKLDDDVVVYCGHGPQTTIGYERQYNSYI